MTEISTSIELPPPFPDHTQLPEEDGTFVKNFQEHPQSIILTDSLGPVLQQLHPDGHYAIGQDCGIYWRETEPPEKGAEAPDWFYVPNVPPLLDGQYRRSYSLWREFVAPLIILEFASGDGTEERDRTSLSYSGNEVTRPGKFWVYERIVRVPYYGIYEVANGNLEVYNLVDGFFEKMSPNERGHYAIAHFRCRIGTVARKLSKPKLSLVEMVGSPRQFVADWCGKSGTGTFTSRTRTSKSRTRTAKGRTRTAKGRTRTAKSRKCRTGVRRSR